MAKTCIVIADDHALFRSGLRKLLESKPHLSVVGETASGDEVATLVKSLKPDILLLDLCLPRLSGLGVLRQLGSSSTTRVILLTASIENSDAVQALQWGIHGIVLKNAATDSVFRSIDAVMEGQYWIFSRGVADLESAVSRLSAAKPAGKTESGRFRLTQREMVVLHAVVSGRANKEIARQFSISEQTVKHHVTSIFNKTGASSRLELTLFAIEHGLVETPSPQ
ncbi:MAG TPA: response regulator transcription factor [Terriglobia bacterium]|nr:response regulator transcription factor [Terriglobia bacterium]